MTGENQNRYFKFELLASCGLLLSLICLLQNALAGFHLLALAGASCGLAVSYLFSSKKRTNNTVFEACAGIGAFCAIAWAVVGILHSSFAYRDVINLCIQGGIIAEIIFSFCIVTPTFLRCIQALSLPLFMCFPVATPAYHTHHIALLGIYLISWAAILRFNFYSLLDCRQTQKRIRYASFIASLVFFALAVSIAWLAFSQSTLGTIKNTGFFRHESGGFGFQEDPIENQYYRLEEQLQQQMNEIIFASESQDEKSQMIYLTSKLIKESPHVADAAFAYESLLQQLDQSQLKTAQNTQETIHAYIDKKIVVLIKRHHEEIEEELKRNIVDVGKWFSLINKSNKLRSSTSFEQVNQYDKEMHGVINRLRADTQTTEALHAHTQQLSEWKEFQLTRLAQSTAEKKQITQSAQGSKIQIKNGPPHTHEQSTRDAAFSIKDKELIAITVSPEMATIPLGKNQEYTAVGIYNDASRADISSFVSWIIDQPSLAAIKKSTVYSRAVGHAKISAELDTIKSVSSFIHITKPIITKIEIETAISRITLDQKINLRAIGYYSDSSQKDISSLVSWHTSNKAIAACTQAILTPLKTGTTRICAHYDGIKSPELTFSIVLPAGWIALRAALGIISLFILIALSLLIMRIVIIHKTKKIKAMLNANPKKFVITIYENMKKIAHLFGFPWYPNTPERACALRIQNHYRIKNNLLFSLTQKYQEARYSSHRIEKNEALIALEHYNTILQAIKNQFETLPLFLKHAALLFRGIPFLL